MPRHVLYAYVDGSDLHDIADALVERFEAFVHGRAWICGQPTVVDQVAEGDPSLKPDWDLGINLDLPDIGSEPANWFSDVEEIARFLAELHRETGRDFVMGIAVTTTGISEDLFSVDSDTPDLALLRKIIGVDPAPWKGSI